MPLPFTLMITVASLALWPLGASVYAQNAASSAPTTAVALSEIQVTLFGQPCLLSGPQSTSSLNAIHAISPEQIPAMLKLPEAQAALEKVRGVNTLPQPLEVYRTRLLLRLEALIAFEAELKTATRTGKSTALLAVAKKFVNPPKWTITETRLQTLATQKGLKDKSSGTRDELLTVYGEAIEAHPEEEFHRALQKMNTQYVCQFEETDKDSTEDGE